VGTSKDKPKGCCKSDEAKTATPCPEAQPKPAEKAKKGSCCSKPTK